MNVGFWIQHRAGVIGVLLLLLLAACGPQGKKTTSAPAPTARPTQAAQPEPEAKPTQPEPEAKPKPVEPKPEPVKPESKPVDKPDPKPVVEPEPKPDPKPVAKPEPQPEPKPVEKPDPKPAAKPEPKPAAKPEPKPAAKPEPKPVAKPEPKPVAKPEPKPAAKPEPKPAAKPEPKPAAKPEPKPAAKPEPKPAAKPEPKPVAKPEPKPVAKPKPTPAQPNGVISGEVLFTGRSKRKLDLAEEAIALVIMDSDQNIPADIVAKDYQIVTKDKTFRPGLLVVPRGATVQFPNQDPIIHNVFSVSKENKFDAGRYSKGEGARHTFLYEGLVRVYCNVHHSMNAMIYISNNPFFTYADEDGRFEIKGLPDGTYTLAAIHKLTGLSKTEVVVANGRAEPVNIELKVRSLRLKPHLNKEGKPYEKRKGERY
ncbi:hypothetical protein [Acanthopleuribacter pedis]|uniref:Rhamnogalacturonan lyase domain-containing protein n=1 Tax=Acanthopleuribacter pedis TaxID=442870 RepID=A0A8J7QKJ7_9BACT|nr:hypothetical protein [Acanthopleuribacter pedis]MBO1319913.1 hypothetical protein [Acanthopleuribacter pedis]